MNSDSTLATSLSGTWLGIGVGLTAATQLRPIDGIPVGPGEAVLAIWVAASLAGLLTRGFISTNRGSAVLAGFWAAAFAILSVGWIVGLTLQRSQPGMARDVVALALSAAVFGVCFLLPDLGSRIRAAQGAFLWTVVLPCLLFLALTAMGRLTLGPIRYWYFDVRFEGWAQNPNQLALAVLALPFWCLFSISRVGNPGAYAVAAVLAILVGLLSRSDALWLAWGVAFACFGAWQVVSLLRRGRVRRGRGILLLFVLPVVVIAILAALGRELLTVAGRGIVREYQENAQGSDRLRRWAHAVEVVRYSPAVGLGPGAFSGPSRPFQQEEAHNTLLDWASSTGFLGTLTLLALVGYVGAEVFRRRDGRSALLLLALGIFASFHYVLRQPMFWLILLGALFPPRYGNGSTFEVG